MDCECQNGTCLDCCDELEAETVNRNRRTYGPPKMVVDGKSVKLLSHLMNVRGSKGARG